MEKVILDQIEVFGTVEPGENEEEFTLSFEVQGANNFHLFSNLLNNEVFDIIVPSLNHEFKAKRLSSSSSYQSPLNQYTEVCFSVTYKEYNEDEKPEWNGLLGTTQTAIGNWARTRAISELLVEKGIITMEEYEHKIGKIIDRDLEEMREFIFEGKAKSEKKIEEKVE